MMNKLPCEIVKDLLPSYIDGLTSDVTNEAVKEHFLECEECRRMYERMTSGDTGMSENDEKEVDFLKTQKKKAKRAVLGGILLTVALVFAVLFIRVFVAGNQSNPGSLEADVKVFGKTVNISGFLLDSAQVVSGVKISEKDGNLIVTVKERLVLFPGSDSFNETYEAKDDIKNIYLNGRLIWQDGIMLASNIERIYALKHPYVGDASANAELARQMGLYNILGECEHELKTSEKPYGWIIKGTTAFSEDRALKISGELTKYGTVLLSLVDNLFYVEFQYNVETETRSIIITADDASRYIGEDIKKAVSSEADLQRLVEKME